MKSPSPSAFRTSVTPPPRDFLNRFSFESSFWSSYELARIDVRAAGGRGDQCPCQDDDHDQGQNQEHNQPSLNTVDVNLNIKDKSTRIKDCLAAPSGTDHCDCKFETHSRRLGGEPDGHSESIRAVTDLYDQNGAARLEHSLTRFSL